MIARVRDPAGNVTHGPHVSGAPTDGPWRRVDRQRLLAQRLHGQARRVLRRDAHRQVERARARAARAHRRDGATVSRSSTSGRSRRNARSASEK